MERYLFQYGPISHCSRAKRYHFCDRTGSESFWKRRYAKPNFCYEVFILYVGNPFEVFPIAPGDDAGLLSDPTILQIGRNTVEYLQSWNDGMFLQSALKFETKPQIPQVLNNFAGNGFPQFYPAAVRVNSNPNEFLQQFSGNINKNMYNNLYVVEQGGGLETAGTSYFSIQRLY